MNIFNVVQFGLLFLVMLVCEFFLMMVINDEGGVLLVFKNGLIWDGIVDLLVMWVGNDVNFCKWEGVICNIFG